jgi:hypothetical protein
VRNIWSNFEKGFSKKINVFTGQVPLLNATAGGVVRELKIVLLAGEAFFFRCQEDAIFQKDRGRIVAIPGISQYPYRPPSS